MSKDAELWTALIAYQPQADAAGHGPSWARMCEKKTAAAAFAAYAKADAAIAIETAYAVEAVAAAEDAAYAAAEAIETAAAAEAASAAALAASAEAKRLQAIAIERIKKILLAKPNEQNEENN